MKSKDASHSDRKPARIADETLLRQHQLFQNALQSLTYPFYIIDAEDYTVRLDNSMPGLQPATPGAKCFEVIHKRQHPCSEAGEKCPLEIVKKTREAVVVEHIHQDTKGQPRHFEIHGYPVFDDAERVTSIIEYSYDITARRQAEERHRFATRVLDLINESAGKTDTIREILSLIKEFTGFEAVGIRLREGNDFPYYETFGFPAEFIESEKHLCSKDCNGELVRDADGHPLLECMCGNVIRGRTDPSRPFFTQGGSFWTNSTTELLESTTEDDLQSTTRNMCNVSGYESVALIPLRSQSECIGLLQLNDKRRDRFSPELIEFFEGIGASIGIALDRNRAEKALQAAHDELEIRVRERTAALVDTNEKLRLEIAERKRTEAALRKKSRALKVLSECNLALVRAKTEAELLSNVCRIIVGIGRYRLAWVGYADHDPDKSVRPVSQEGFEDGYLETLNLSWADVPRGRGPTGTAIRCGKPSVSTDIMIDPRFKLWREEASKRGYASSIALPLQSGDEVFGALSIYATERDAFDDEEVDLLIELSHDLAFGIMTLRTESERQSAEHALGESETRYRELVEGTDNLVMQLDGEARITFVNNAARKIFGLAPEECIGLNSFELVHPDDCQRTEEAFRQWISSKTHHTTFENRILGRTDRVSDMLWTIDIHYNESRSVSFLNYIARDITERKKAEEDLHYRLGFEKLVANLSTDFINLKTDEIDEGINHALTEVGKFARVDRSYIFQFSNNGESMSNTHEWCEDGIKPQIDTLQNLSTRDFPWTITHFRRFEMIHVPSVEDLPPEASNEKQTFEEQDIKSLVLVPMSYGGRLLGFIGFDAIREERSWDESTIALLKIVDEMFVSAIVRSRAEKKLREANEKLVKESRALHDKNIAMREVLSQIEEDKQAIRQQISTNVEEALLPLVARIKKQSRESDRQLIELLEQYLKDISSPFMDSLRSSFSKLTPRELEVCHMIKAGRPSKDIASLLNVSLLTVHKHREQIRRKLGLKNSNINLSSYLQSF